MPVVQWPMIGKACLTAVAAVSGGIEPMNDGTWADMAVGLQQQDHRADIKQESLEFQLGAMVLGNK